MPQAMSSPTTGLSFCCDRSSKKTRLDLAKTAKVRNITAERRPILKAAIALVASAGFIAVGLFREHCRLQFIA
jgi:hypothetical protein